MSARFSIDNIPSDVEARHPGLPWTSLRPADHPRALVAQARHFWSENAFNEWASAQAMAALVEALDAAAIPAALVDEARTFPADELVHVELCAGVARRLGGGVDIPYHPAALRARHDPTHTPLERATALVIRTCCVGEAVAQPLLTGNLRAARQPLARAVLARIVRDETRHARFGWDYLDWIAPRLSPPERRRLGDEVGALLGPLVAGLAAPAPTSSSDADGGGLGWMPVAEWRALAQRTIAGTLLARLARYGIAPR